MRSLETDVIRPVVEPLKGEAGFINLSGNLFDSAIMKTSVISPDFRARYLSDPDDPEAFEGTVFVFDGPEHFHAVIDDPALGMGEDAVLVMRGAGPLGYPGAAEVVNMRPPAYLLKRGIPAVPCIGDGRQSGTSGSPSILNASPEAAAGEASRFCATATGSASTCAAAGSMCCCRTRSWRPAGQPWPRPAAMRCRPARPPGRRSSAT